MATTVSSSGRLLLVSVPLFGHLGPLVRIGQELARRGWRVAVATTRDGRHHVERAAGVDLVDLGPAGIDAAAADEIVARVCAEPDFARGLGTILQTMTRIWPAMFDAVRAVVAGTRPDLMVVDLASTAGLDVAQEAGVPCVVNNPDLLGMLPPGLLPPAAGLRGPLAGRGRGLVDRLAGHRLVYRAVAALTIGRAHNACRRTRGLPPVTFNTRLDATPVLVNSAFGLEYPRPLPPLVHMTGPILPDEDEPLPPDLDRWLGDGPPVAFVNMGTVAIPSPAHLHALAGGLACDRFRALWVARPPARAHMPSALAPGIRLECWVPSQMAVLRHPNVRAFVTHCGTNSVQESLHCGTPVVGVPLFAAQRDMGLRVQDAGVGLVLDKGHLTADGVRAAVLRVLDDDDFRNGIPAIQSSFRLAGGRRRAADLVEHFARFGVTGGVPPLPPATRPPGRG